MNLKNKALIVFTYLHRHGYQTEYVRHVGFQNVDSSWLQVHQSIGEGKLRMWGCVESI